VSDCPSQGAAWQGIFLIGHTLPIKYKDYLLKKNKFFLYLNIFVFFLKMAFSRRKLERK
jgi:hypothetical protein